MLYLVNVPQWTTTMPPVALTCLSGYFENQNIEYNQIDINIKLYNYVFRYDFFKKVSKYISKDIRYLLDGTEIDYNEYLALNIEQALMILRDKNKILDREKLEWSNKIINDYLNMINQYFTPVKISLNSMTFGLDGIITYSEIIDNILNSDQYKNLDAVYREILTDIEFKPKALVGFSINNLSQLINAIFISRIMRERVKGHFFLGGSYISANQATLTKCDRVFELFDSICLYDGEHAIQNLYNYFFYGEQLKYKNIMFKDNRRVYAKTEYYIENIEELPVPSYKGINFEEYLSPVKIISLPVSRGCYGNCSFCSYNHLASSKWREQSVEQIIESIKICKERYGSCYFFFSVATLSPRMAKELSKRLISEKIKIYWASGIRMEAAFDEEVISLMSKAGCIRLDIGIESASQEVLNAMNKRVKNIYFRDIIYNMYKNGILPYLYIIKNFPTENMDDWKETVKFLQEVKNEILGFSCYDFFLSPNTKVFIEPQKYGVEIEKEVEDKDVVDIVKAFRTKFISEHERENKEVLLNEYYKRNNEKFIHYGNAYIDRKMPLTFPNQMLYITQKADEEVSYKVEKKRVYYINKRNVIMLESNQAVLKLFSLKTCHSLVISLKLYEILEKELSVEQLIERYGLDTKNILKVLTSLLKEGIIC